jgi:type I restriction enzyme S subunit
MLNPTAECDYFAGYLREDHMVNRGDLLFSWSATLTTTIWDREPGAVNQHIFKVIPKEETTLKFFHHLIDFSLEGLAGMAHGSTMRHIKRKDLLPYEVVVPNELAEQSRIAEILDTVDEAIRTTERLIEKLKAIKTGLLHDLLTCGIDENGRLRDPIAHPEQFKKTDLGIIPSAWSIAPLGKLARVRRGASPRPISSPVWFSEEGPGWIRITDVTKAGRLLTRTEQRLSKAGVQRSVCVYPGQVVMSICATIGEPILLGLEACIHDGFVVFDEHEGTLDGRFLVLLLAHRQDYFRNQGQTGTQANLNTGIVGAATVAVPDMDEQKKICSTWESLEDRVDAETGVLRKLNSMKKGLMHDLLTGKVRVPIDEEAEA